MLGIFTACALTTTCLVACLDLSTDDEEVDDLATVEQESCVHDELAELRRITARYRNVKEALADGYKLGVKFNRARVVTDCIAHPTLGAMGYHYFKQERFDDAKIKELKPEALVYYTGHNGRLELGAVEWVVPKPAWEAKHGVGAEPPEVYGHHLSVLNPVLDWYVGHAWIWKDNPSGVFSDWNPAVTCP